VYPHFLLSRAPEMTLVDVSRKANDGQVDRAIATLERDLGSVDGVDILVLGLTYRHGVKELAYSRALPLIDGLRARGARVFAFDPLLDDEEIVHVGAVPWSWGTAAETVRAIVTQTADPQFASLDPAWFPALSVVFDGRNSLRELSLPDGIAYHGVGVGSTPAR
jgi:UDP-N-acetyl-D-mannosaminuronate dehydrogenase